MMPTIDRMHNEIVEIVQSHPNIQETVEAMKRFAFWGFWNNVAGRLKQLTGITSLRTDVWVRYLAIQWKKALDNDDIMYTNFSLQGTEESYCILDTKLRDTHGQTIYCGFRKDPQSNPNRAEWQNIGYCTINDSENVIARILRERLATERRETPVSLQQWTSGRQPNHIPASATYTVPSSGHEDRDFMARALDVIWRETSAPSHQVFFRNVRVDIEGANLFDISNLLRRNNVDWRHNTEGYGNIRDWLANLFPVCFCTQKVSGADVTSVVFQYKSLSDYAACSAYDQLKATPIKWNALKSMLFQKKGIRASEIENAFQAYSTCLRQTDNDCEALGKVVVSMPEAIKTHTFNTICNAIDEDLEKSLLVSKVPSVAPWIIHYYRSGELQTWLSEHFDFHISARSESNSAMAVRYGGDTLTNFIQVVHGKLSAIRGQSVRVDELEELVSNTHIDLTALSPDHSFNQWLPKLLETPDIHLTEDGNSIYIPLPSNAKLSLPVCSHILVKKELQQAENICYMPWSVLRGMASLAGIDDLPREVVVRFFSHRMALLFSGIEKGLLIDEVDDGLRIMLPMGLQTPNGSEIYAALEPNSEIGQQRYRLSAFATPGEDDEAGYGVYICEHFGIAVSTDTQRQYEALQTITDELSELQEQIINALPSMQEAVTVGKAGETDKILATLMKWHHKWAEAQKIVLKLGWLYDMPDPSLFDIQERMHSTSIESQIMTGVISSFDTMAAQIDEFLASLHFATVFDQAREQIQEDRLLVSTMQQVRQDDIPGLRVLLDAYDALRIFAESIDFTLEYGQEQKTISQHFHLLPFQTQQLIGTASKKMIENPPLACLNALDNIHEELNRVELNLQQKNAKNDKQKSASSERLLELLTSGEAIKDPGDPFPEDEVEAMIVRGDYETARKQIVEKSDIDEACRERLLRSIEIEAQKPCLYTLNGIAERLMNTVGNQHQTAEIYLLLSCLQGSKDDKEALRMLLSLYCNEDREDAFMEVVSLGGNPDTVRTQKYCLCAMCNRTDARAVSYLNEHYFLIYEEECLMALRRLNVETDRADIMTLIRCIQPREKKDESVDQIVEAIRNGQLPELEERLKTDGKIENTQLSVDQIETLRGRLLDADSFQNGSDPLSVGRRFWSCLGNWNRNAEYAFWDALASFNPVIRNEAAIQLAIILGAEARWQECIELCGRFQDAITQDDSSCAAYIQSMLWLTPKKAIEVIRNNIVVFLSLCKDNDTIYNRLDELSLDTEDSEVATAYKQICRLVQLLSDTLIRSIIFQGRSLSELVAQPEAMREMGMSQDEVKHAQTLRRTNEYPIGRDALSIALRLYAFVGNRGGAAEAFALYAMPDTDAAELLCDIYRHEDRKEELLQIIRSNDEVRSTHHEEYCELLFEAGSDTDLCAELDQRYTGTPVERILRTVLSIRSNDLVDESQEKTWEYTKMVSHKLIAMLCDALVRANQMDRFYGFLRERFSSLLTEWSVEDICRLFSETNDVQRLDIQNRALNDGDKDLAVFLWSQKQTGNLQKLAEENCAAEMAGMSNASHQEKFAILERLRKIYPNYDDSLSVQRLIIELTQLTSESDNATETAELAVERLGSAKLSALDLSQMLESIREDVLIQEPILNWMQTQSENETILAVCLDYYHKRAEEVDHIHRDESFLDFLYILYLHAIKAGIMPESMLAEAEMICCEGLKTSNQENATLCLYYIERKLGREERMLFALYQLSYSNEDSMEMNSEVADLSRHHWPNGMPNMLALFEEVLKSRGTADVLAYCQFCACFINDTEELLHIHKSSGERLMTETETSDMLRWLYLNTDSYERWNECAVWLPVQAPASRCRLKLIACCKAMGLNNTIDDNHAIRLWTECATLCFENEQDDILLETLEAWSAKAEEEKTRIGKIELLMNCRNFIEEKVKEDKTFFGRWKNSGMDKVGAIVRRLMGLIPEQYGTSQETAFIVTSLLVANMQDTTFLHEYLEHKGTLMMDRQPDLGFDLFCNLMVVNSYDDAAYVLSLIQPYATQCRYERLIERLGGKNASELKEWHQSYGNQSLMQLALPGCKVPPLQVLYDWAVDCIKQGKNQDGIELMDTFLDIFTDNDAFQWIKFAIQKRCAPVQIEAIHHTICQILKSARFTDMADYDALSMEDYAYFLAGLNAVCIVREETRNYDYDFSIPAGSFYSLSAINRTGEETLEKAQRINAFQNELNDLMRNRDEEGQKRIYAFIVAWVSGEWSDVLSESWNNLQDWEDLWSISLPVVAYGLSRSIVNFLFNLPDDQRSDALTWVNSMKSDYREVQLKAASLAFDHLLEINDHEFIDTQLPVILRFPLEAPFLSGQIINNALNQDLLSSTDNAKHMTTAIIAMMACPKTLVSLNKRAIWAFGMHKDRMSSAIFYGMARCAEALLLCNHLTVDVHNLAERKKGTYNGRFAKFDHTINQTAIDLLCPKRVDWKAFYNAYVRFHRFRKLISLLSSDPQLQPNETIEWRGPADVFNIVIQLFTTTRANEALFLRRCIPEEYREIVDGMILAMNPRVRDDEKIRFVERMKNDAARRGMYLILADQPDKPLRDSSRIEECRRRKQEWSMVRLDYVDYLQKFKLAEVRNQKEPPSEEVLQPRRQETFRNEEVDNTVKTNRQNSETKEELVSQINALMQLEPLSTEDDPEDPLRYGLEFESLERLGITPERRKRRLEVARILYCMSLAGRCSEDGIDMLVQYVMEVFMYPDEQDIRKSTLILLVAPLVRQTKEKLRTAFRDLVTRAAIGAVMRIQTSSLVEYLQNFASYRDNYDALLEMVTDEEAVRIISIVYEVLDGLCKAYRGVGGANISQMRSALSDARIALSGLTYSRNLGRIDTTINNLILQECNRLDEQPLLVLRVLNEGGVRSKDKLFGEVENIGRSEARNIVLRLTYGEKVSAPYKLNLLSGGGKAVFDIGFELGTEANKLEYQIDVVCSSKTENQFDSETVNGVLPVVKEELPYFDTEAMNIGTIMFFTPNDSGDDVWSEDFVGRVSEKRLLRALYDGKSFPECRNAVVYGIRRSGKTSILNYIVAYLNNTRDDMIALTVSGQEATTIHGVFIKPVLSKLKSTLLRSKSGEEGYNRLRDRWEVLKNGALDIEPADLLSFYVEVNEQLGGKGIILIVDEFDRLIECLNTRQTVKTAFYNVLSSALCDASMASVIHFLFCGSKELIMEKGRDGQSTQLFQRMGASDILIGAMPKQDLITMITQPYMQYECVKFTDAALEWLWSMAGGLVWISKLIAIRALKIAEKESRSVVYPSDIYIAACGVSENNEACRQFYEGFRDDECLVVEAIGYIAVKPDQYVNITQLIDILQDRLTRDQIERALRNIAHLEIIEHNRQNMNQVRFKVDIYRRYFRAQVEHNRVLPTNEDLDINFHIVLNT